MKARFALILILLALLLTACSLIQSSSPPPSIDKMEQTWQEQRIDSYRIEVLVVTSVWHAQSHQITILNNRVENATAACTPAPAEAGSCQVQAFNAEDYTVPGLFARARAQAESQAAAWIKISYDPVYGFPTHIAYDHPELIDEDWVWRVTAFEVLK